jgi:hypothetical protein
MSTYANSPGSDEAATQQYVRALLDLVGDREPLDILSELPDRVEELTRSVDDATLRKPEREGKWSMIEVAQHLADAELVLSFRYRMILAHDTPEITGYDQEAFANRLHYGETPLEEVLELLRVVRRANVRLLRSLTAEERARGGMHSERGFEDVNRLMQLNAAHDLVHRAQLERVKKAVG